MDLPDPTVRLKHVRAPEAAAAAVAAKEKARKRDN